MKARGGIIGGVAAILAVAPAAAQARSINLPAGSLGQQVMALGRVARVSVAVPDPRLWARPMPAVRNARDADAALAMIARNAQAQAERIGPGSWRLAARRVAVRPAPRRKPPLARPAPPTSTEAEVVVTASKRDVTRNNFAGQFARVDGRDLEFGGTGGTDRLSSRMTTVASTYLGAGRNKLFIRGIADSSFTGPTQATVGQYLGDLRLSYNSPDPDLRLADLAAVEVLAGPQGALYGAGSLGGLIRLVPNTPDLARVTGSATVGVAATQHGAPGSDAQAVLNLPLVEDRFGLRVVMTAAEEGGYIDKPLLDRTDVNRTRIMGGRAAGRMQLADGWTIDLIGVGQRIRGDDSQYAERGKPPLIRLAAVDEGFRSDFTQGQLVVTGAIGSVHVKSSTGVTAHDLMERYDATPTGQPARLFAQANRTRMTANETRLWQSAPDGSGWLAGFSYTDNDTRLTRMYGAPGALVPTTGVSNIVRETTLYGEGSKRLFPGLLVTGGLRLTRSVLDGASEDAAPVVVLLGRAVTARRVQSVALPSASALVDLSLRTSLFVRYQQGFRPGGLAIEDNFVRRFESDRVATVEAGLRHGRPARDPLDLSLTVAHTSWRNIQADFIDSAGLPSTANIGDGRLWSVEATAGAQVAPGLRVEGAVSYNDSHIKDPTLALMRSFANPTSSFETARADVLARLRQIPNIARITARAGAVYRRELTETSDLKVDGWLRYVGPSRLGVGPVLGQSQGRYVDSGITVRLGLARFGVTAGVTNLTDARGNRFALGTPMPTGRDYVTPMRPRTFRLGLDTAF